MDSRPVALTAYIRLLGMTSWFREARGTEAVRTLLKDAAFRDAVGFFFGSIVPGVMVPDEGTVAYLASQPNVGEAMGSASSK